MVLGRTRVPVGQSFDSAPGFTVVEEPISEMRSTIQKLESRLAMLEGGGGEGGDEGGDDGVPPRGTTPSTPSSQRNSQRGMGGHAGGKGAVHGGPGGAHTAESSSANLPGINK